MNCISGFYPATSGSVNIFNTDVYTHPKQARMNLGVCAQDDTRHRLPSSTRWCDMAYFRVPVDEGRRRRSRFWNIWP
jgi:ABC-type branched-subunit amino acid transport system ATPase component